MRCVTLFAAAAESRSCVMGSWLVDRWLVGLCHWRNTS